MPVVTYLALDGSTAVIETAEIPIQSPATSSVVALIDGAQRQFTTSIVADAFRYADYHGVKLDEQYDLGSQPVWVGAAEHSDHFGRIGQFRLALWEGKQFALLAHVYNGTSDQLLRILAEFEIEEFQYGIGIRPRDARRTPFKEGPVVARGIHRLGLVDLYQLTPERLEQLPSRKGLVTSSGELFRQPTTVDGSPVIVLVGDTFFARILPDPEAAEDEYLENISGTRYEWLVPA